MSVETRYWERVGMYVTQQFAEEWIEKMGEGSSTSGKYLDDEVEEYIAPQPVATWTIREEIEALFAAPREEVEIPLDTQAIIAVTEMEMNKISRIKELKAEGYDLKEAKEIVAKEINDKVAEILGVDVEEYVAKEDARYEESRKGAESDGDEANDESE
jgi:uncharacterized protein YoaH (UPF0181 family)